MKSNDLKKFIFPSKKRVIIKSNLQVNFTLFLNFVES